MGSIYIITDLNVDVIVGTFYEKELQKTNQKGFRIEKVIKRKRDKLYVKWKGYDYIKTSFFPKPINNNKKKKKKKNINLIIFF